MSTLNWGNATIDHVAIAVHDLEEALFFYRDILGFKLVERREVSGSFSGMLSAELTVGKFSIVLIQGTSVESQVTKYIENYGAGVQHVAISVDDVEAFAKKLVDKGLEFATDIIKGENLIQVFSKRDNNSGMMFELIQRDVAGENFQQSNIQELFNQLERSSAY